MHTSETGQVFKARHQTMGRIVTIKILSSGAVRSVEYVERFRRKVKALARLSHPNLVTAFDAGESGDRPSGDRPKSMEEVASDLERLVEELPGP